MQERLNQYRPILAVLIVACGLMAAVTSRYDMPLFYICLGAWALLSLGCIIWMTVITRQNRRRFGRLKDSLEHIMSDAVLSLPMPSLIVRESGEVVWSNPPAKQGVFPGQELFGHNIAELVPGLDWQAESSAEGRDIVIGERHYTVFLMHSSSTKEPLTIICLVDDNDLKHYTQEYFDSRPYVLTMLIDNYSELFTDAKENERSRTMGQIEHIIETFAEENHGLVKKLDRDRFLAGLLGVLFIGDDAGNGNDDEHIGKAGIGDEDLGAIEDPVVAIQHGKGLLTLCVGAGARLSQTESTNPFAAAQLGQVIFLLLLGAVLIDRSAA